MKIYKQLLTCLGKMFDSILVNKLSYFFCLPDMVYVDNNYVMDLTSENEEVRSLLFEDPLVKPH